MTGTVSCDFCDTGVTPGKPGTFQGVHGYEEPRGSGGANMIHLRKPLQEFVCSGCMRKLKRGIDPGQATLA